MVATTNYGFEKPTVGGDNNTWGDDLNNNWDDLDALLRTDFPYLSSGDFECGLNGFKGINNFIGSFGVSYSAAANQTWVIDSDNNSTANAFLWGMNALATASYTEIMRLTEGSNLSLGLTTTAGNIRVDNASSNCLDLRRNSTGQIAVFRSSIAGSLVGSITVNASTTTYNTSSDENLKDIHGDVDPREALAIIAAIDVVHAAFKDAPNDVRHMCIAQQVYEYLPEVVEPGNDLPIDDEDFSPWLVDYSKFVPILISGIQALQQENVALDSRVKLLEKAVAQLTDQMMAFRQRFGDQ